MTAKWVHIFIFGGSFITSAVSGFIVYMRFHHDRYWTSNRFGGLPVALACIPIRAVSYVVGTVYVFRWLRPRLKRRLRPYLQQKLGSDTKGNQNLPTTRF